MATNSDKPGYQSVSTEFSSKKLRDAYAALRKAWDAADEARTVFDNLLKVELHKKQSEDAHGKIAESPDHIEVSHRYGLQFWVVDEPIAPKKARAAKRSAVSV